MSIFNAYICLHFIFIYVGEWLNVHIEIYIFVMRFLLINVMKLAGDVHIIFISLQIKMICYP